MRYVWLWLVFIAAMFVGAALVSQGGGLLWVGLLLLLGPLVALGILTIAYYLLERRKPSP